MADFDKRIETLLASAGMSPDLQTGAVVPPIHLATTFEKTAAGGFHYTREANPTRQTLESVLAKIAAGTTAVAFSSGMAAAASIVGALGAGSRVVYPADVYVGVRKLLRDVAPRWGIEAHPVAFDDIENVASIVNESTLVWVETPSNPMLRITDIQAVVDMARSRGARTLVDNTWPTPLIQKPLALGVDFSLHSLTKYIAGHTDVLGGAIIAADEGPLVDAIREQQIVAGAVLDPFSSWLTLRGLRTLAVRMQVACDNADRLASFLSEDNRVARVHYPGLPTHPGRPTAEKQMSRAGAMLSFETRAGAEGAMAVAERTRVFVNATSLGGTESLLEHRASSEGPGTPTPETLIRVSVGIEHVDDLIADLDQALSAA